MKWVCVFFIGLSNAYGQTNGNITFYRPHDWMGDTLTRPFSSNTKYFGIYEKDKQKEQSVLRHYNGKDTIEDFGWGKQRVIVKSKDDPAFVVSGFDMKPDQVIKGKHLKAQRLLPGQAVTLTLASTLYTIYATGHEVDSSRNVNPFKRIKNYRIAIRSVTGKSIREQVLFEGDLTSWENGRYVTGVLIYWIGDLNDDKSLDIVLTTSTHWTVYHVQLYLGQEDNDKLVKLASEYIVSVD